MVVGLGVGLQAALLLVNLCGHLLVSVVDLHVLGSDPDPDPDPAPVLGFGGGAPYFFGVGSCAIGFPTAGVTNDLIVNTHAIVAVDCSNVNVAVL